jgi:hypothetical protein
VGSDDSPKAKIVASLPADVNRHQITAHQLLAMVHYDRNAFLRQQHEISGAFHDAMETFPSGNDIIDLLRRAEGSWQSALIKAGVWGDQVTTFKGPHNERQAQLDANGYKTEELLTASRIVPSMR